VCHASCPYQGPVEHFHGQFSPPPSPILSSLAAATFRCFPSHIFRLASPVLPFIAIGESLRSAITNRLGVEDEDTVASPKELVPVAKKHRVRIPCTITLFCTEKLLPLCPRASAKPALMRCLLTPLLGPVYHRRWPAKPMPFVLRSTLRIRPSRTP
jgi:hypothetical protein